jgi:hypothetical protein
MEIITYLSRNAKKPPFEVLIQIQGNLTFINCNCALGQEKKICRHKINAIRGDKDKKHRDTTESTIEHLKMIFGSSSSLRQHLEEKWRILREFSANHPEAGEQIEKKRKILGEAFSNGFLNQNIYKIGEPFDADAWEAERSVFVQDLTCNASLIYTDNEGKTTQRDVIIDEVFSSNEVFYFLAHCLMRKQTRTFRVDRIQGIEFPLTCNQATKSLLLDIIFRGKAI